MRIGMDPFGARGRGLSSVATLDSGHRGRRQGQRPARRARTHFARRAILAASLAATIVAGCSSPSSSGAAATGSAKTGRPVEIRYRAVSANATFGLVNESHTDRTQLYSSRLPLDAASTKVSPDEVVDAMVDYFREQGFFEHAQAGAMPANAPSGVTQILAVTTVDGPVLFALRTGAPTEQARSFQTCAKAFFDVYNNTIQLQSVDRAPDWKAQNSALKPRQGG